VTMERSESLLKPKLLSWFSKDVMGDFVGRMLRRLRERAKRASTKGELEEVEEVQRVGRVDEPKRAMRPSGR
jgi:hypothetical protein